jgi:hypothetical protein
MLILNLKSTSSLTNWSAIMLDSSHPLLPPLLLRKKPQGKKIQGKKIQNIKRKKKNS